jgi:hypothetical protein
MKWLDLVNKSKFLRTNSRYVASLLKPAALYRASLPGILERAHEYDQALIDERVNYCNQLTAPFRLEVPMTLGTFQHDGNTSMQMDLKSVLRYFDQSQCFNCVLGDTTKNPDTPSFLKSRPIDGEIQNSVLLKLNSARHYTFINDPTPFEKKENMAIWRGTVFKRRRRIALIENCFDHPQCDLGDTDKKKIGQPTYRPFITLSEQLRNKFIISVEGNDVATNTKWIMSSNSLCFMPRPRYETWFMEGRLKPDHHYVLLKDDFSDLGEKIDYYSRHTDAALEIIAHAQKYVSPFLDRKLEQLVALRVAQKYFELCENNRA